MDSLNRRCWMALLRGLKQIVKLLEKELKESTGK
jgi:hypothetical protein